MFPGLIIRVSSYVFGSTISKFYTKEKLSNLVEIKISSQSSGITVNCSELPNIDVCLEITNLLPLNITIHEIEADFYFPGRVTHFVKICNMDIDHKKEKRLFLQTDLNKNQVTYIKKHKGDETPRLKINAMLSCSLSSFEINDREITTNNIEFKNCNYSWRRFFS